MRRLLLYHEHEGFAFVPSVFEPSDGLIDGDVGDVGDVALGFVRAFFVDESRIVVVALSGDDIEVVVALGLHMGAEVPLADHDKAIETLEAASKMDGPIFLNRELDLWFIFDRLRGNPRFDALLE